MEKNRKSYTDQEILEVISLLMAGEGDEEQLSFWLDNQLYGIEDILDVIFHSKQEFTPQQALDKARELSKPILL